ncbi:5-methyltetrahydropteroyltriglutamate--homocysteine S-methyltransferase [Microbaculum marinum]|uniref:5-methyltetrahydropteroyltriglutamate--homocysteine S-methyltransferase n=1 Tax=Microbaculum marinum TaxID=1764581 RepID=A0AAW9RGU4_9HYPH
MQRTTPPYRADHVGSILRTQPLKEARAKREAGEISAEDLTAVEDQEIRKIIARQEEVGLKLATDGEFRRSWWHFDFLTQLDGVDLVVGEKKIQFHGIQTKAHSLNISGRVGFSSHPFVDHFKFVKDNTNVMAKMTIPSPSVLHFRLGRNSISRDIYPDIDTFFADTAAAYRKAVNAFAAAGCKYLQLDDTVWAYLCSAEQCEQARERGDDPDALPKIYADMINHAIAERPDDMAITMHVCRGNFRSSWISEGGYEPVAEVMFNEVDIDGYFLEYDTDRAGGFEPLRFMPKGDKQVVLGLITSKSGTLEAKDDVKRRIEEATEFVDLEQCCLSPQCGFASTEEGNILTEDQQWAKLREIVELSEEIWG